MFIPLFFATYKVTAKRAGSSSEEPVFYFRVIFLADSNNKRGDSLHEERIPFLGRISALGEKNQKYSLGVKACSPVHDLLRVFYTTDRHVRIRISKSYADGSADGVVFVYQVHDVERILLPTITSNAPKVNVVLFKVQV